MKTTTFSDFKKNMDEHLTRVSEDFETLLVSNGKDGGVVIISLKEFNSIQTTMYEMSSRANEKRLDAAIEKLASWNSFGKDLWNT